LVCEGRYVLHVDESEPYPTQAIQHWDPDEWFVTPASPFVEEHLDIERKKGRLE
jgi:hypothetical protein